MLDYMYAKQYLQANLLINTRTVLLDIERKHHVDPCRRNILTDKSRRQHKAINRIDVTHCLIV